MIFIFIPTIETKRLILRKAKLSDLEDIYINVWSDSRLNKYMIWELCKSKDDALERLKRTIEFHKNNYAYFICEKESDHVIGFAGIMETKESGVYSEIGICIANDYQNKGYGTEVLNALKKLVFEILNGNKFIYSSFEENESSKALAIKSGFIYFNQEKICRKYDKKEFVKYDYYIDKEMYTKENLNELR